ncbi:MAG TPA: polysaccharide biosynthesis tyrosine autokinase [Gemmatimonadaceae bacterium]|nr:polysaccharide biosynthesis tyrosine autokinase [Gemmatimonadaceae bacterium]
MADPLHASRDGDGPSPPNATGSPHAHQVDYAALFVRRWWLLLLLPGLVAGGVWLVQSRRPERYTATAMLQREERRSPLETISPDRPDPSLSQAVLSEIEILRSRAVLGAVVDSLGLRAELPGRGGRRTEIFEELRLAPSANSGTWLLSREGDTVELRQASGQLVAAAPLPGPLDFEGVRIRLTADGGSHLPLKVGIVDRESAISDLTTAIRTEPIRATTLFRLSFRDPDPLMASRVVNAITDVFIRAAAVRNRQEAIRRRQFISKQLATVAESLSLAQTNLATYQKQSRTLDPEVEGQALAGALMQAESDVRTLRFQEGLIQSLLSTLQTAGATDDGLQRLLTISRDLVPGAEDQYRRLRDLETEKARLTAGRFGLTGQGGNIEALDSLITGTRAEMRGAAAETLRLLREKRGAADDHVADLTQKVGTIPARAGEFKALQQRVDAVQRTFDMLAAKHYEALIVEAVEAGNVTVIDHADVPQRADPAHLARNVLLALLGGLFLAISLAVLLESLDRSVRSSADVKRITGLPALATVPDLRHIHDRDAVSRDAFDGLRTNLQFARTKPCQVIAITSAVPREGKSFTAQHLAATLASHGKRVVLVDLDLRRPSLHKNLEIPRAPGVTDILVGNVSVVEAVHALAEKKEFVVCCGSRAPSPTALIGSEAFPAMLAELRSGYDMVVVDTPPVLAVTDPSLLAPLMDGMVVVVRCEKTDQTALSHAVEQLRRAGANVLGAVINLAPVRTRGYGYQYGYFYSYAYHDAEMPGRMSAMRRRIAVLFGREG